MLTNDSFKKLPQKKQYHKFYLFFLSQKLTNMKSAIKEWHNFLCKKKVQMLPFPLKLWNFVS